MDAEAIEEADAKVRATVEGILSDVKKRGNVATRELSQKFDNWSPKDFRLNPAEIEKAISQVSKRDLDDIQFAQAQVRNFAQKQKDTMRDLEVETLPGVKETLDALAGRYRILLITKGDLFDQERKLAQSGLGDYFSAVEIVSDNAINVVHDRVKEGDSVAKPLESTKIFPGMVTSMIEVGEETSAPPDMLVRIADTYDEDVDNAVAGLTSIIEPIMIVGVGAMVGFVAVALVQAMYGILDNMKQQT